MTVFAIRMSILLFTFFHYLYLFFFSYLHKSNTDILLIYFLKLMVYTLYFFSYIQKKKKIHQKNGSGVGIPSAN